MKSYQCLLLSFLCLTHFLPTWAKVKTVNVGILQCIFMIQAANAKMFLGGGVYVCMSVCLYMESQNCEDKSMLNSSKQSTKFSTFTSPKIYDHIRYLFFHINKHNWHFLLFMIIFRLDMWTTLSRSNSTWIGSSQNPRFSSFIH